MGCGANAHLEANDVLDTGTGGSSSSVALFAARTAGFAARAVRICRAVFAAARDPDDKGDRCALLAFTLAPAGRVGRESKVARISACFPRPRKQRMLLTVPPPCVIRVRVVLPRYDADAGSPRRGRYRPARRVRSRISDVGREEATVEGQARQRLGASRQRRVAQRGRRSPLIRGRSSARSSRSLIRLGRRARECGRHSTPAAVVNAVVVKELLLYNHACNHLVHRVGIPPAGERASLFRVRGNSLRELGLVAGLRVAPHSRSPRTQTHPYLLSQAQALPFFLLL